MALFARALQPREHQLYGILDDEDLFKQLGRPTSEYETLERYPSFHPPAGNSSSGVVGSHQLYGIVDDEGDEDDEDIVKELARPTSEYEALGRYPSFHPPAGIYSSGIVRSSPTGEPLSPSYPSPAPPAGQLHSEDSDSEGSLYMQPYETAHKEAPQSQSSTDITGESWFNPQAESWKPKKATSSNKARRAPPNRPTPTIPAALAPQNTSAPPRYAYVSPASSQEQPLTGILIREPDRTFAKAKGPPRKSAMKTPMPPVQEQRLTGILIKEPDLPFGKAEVQRLPVSKSSSTKASSVAFTTASISKASSTSTSSVAFTTACPSSHSGSIARSNYGSSNGSSSVAFTSSSSYYSSSAPRSATRYLSPLDDDSPIEPSGPRQTLFVVNADVEESPMPFIPPLPPSSSKFANPKRKHKLSAVPMPLVPPLPPQFQAPSPPSPTSLNRPPAPWSPIPFPVASRYSSRTGGSPNRHRRLSGASSSSESDDASSSSSLQPRYKRSKLAQSTMSSAEDAIPAEWIHPLMLTLEQLFTGGTYTYRITTRMLSGEPKIQEVQIDVKPGWKAGTKIIFPGAANERAPGVFQTLIFVVEQVHHERFGRLDGGRLVYNQDIDLVDALKENGKREPRQVVGLDGKVIVFNPPRGVIRQGQEMVIKGEGMYMRSKGKVVGRGDLIIRWKINSYAGDLAFDPGAVASSSPVAPESTLSTSTSNTGTGSVSTLMGQHTVGSLATSGYTQAASTSTPASSLEVIRETSTMSVLQPSDSAQHEAAFQTTTEAPITFHADLERRYSNSSSLLDLEDPPQEGEGVLQETFVLPLQSVMAHTPSSSPLLASKPETTNSSFNASPEGSPVATSTALNLPMPSPKIELRVLELYKQLMDNTLENKTPEPETSNTEEAAMDFQDAHREKTSVATEPPSPKECSVPKAEFNTSLKDAEEVTKELEENEKKSEERQKEPENLATQAAKLQSKNEALESTNVDSHNAAAKETPEEEIPEAAVERLREQVESACRQSGDVSHRNSSSLKVSERYGPSSTRAPLAWNHRANATDTVSPPTPTMEQTPLDVASHNVNRLSQVISITPTEPLPELEELQRSNTCHSESVRSPTILSPPLPIINHSEHDGPSIEELSQNINVIVDGFPDGRFDTGVPAALTKPKASPPKAPAPKVSTLMSPSRASYFTETQSIRSEHTASSLQDPSTRGKKKGWMSRFKVKLP